MRRKKTSPVSFVSFRFRPTRQYNTKWMCIEKSLKNNRVCTERQTWEIRSGWRRWRGWRCHSVYLSSPHTQTPSDSGGKIKQTRCENRQVDEKFYISIFVSHVEWNGMEWNRKTKKENFHFCSRCVELLCPSRPDTSDGPGCVWGVFWVRAFGMAFSHLKFLLWCKNRLETQVGCSELILDHRSEKTSRNTFKKETKGKEGEFRG